MLAIAACSNTPSDLPLPSDVASVVVSPSTSSVSIGGRLSLSAVVQDSAGQTLADADIFWSVQDASIATISSDGVVTGVAPGTTQVSANVAGKSGIGTVTVQRTAVPTIAVASVTISPSKPPAIAKNDNLTLTATLKDASGRDIGPGRAVTWTSSDPSIASVTAKTGTYSATVKGNKEGTAIITATSEGKSASVTVTVKH
jgi:uncharacterized protein YjdB